MIPVLSLVACLTLSSAPAAAQGTMTPSAPPGGTPSQPPPLPPPAAPPPPAEPAPAVQPAQPATTSNPTAAGAAGQAAPVETEERSDAPKARTGFQMAFRTGVAVPLGEVDKGSKMSDAFSPQVPIQIDLGAKVIPNLFIGGYLGIAFGGAAGNLSDLCDRGNFSCVAVGLRIGAQIQYHILPDGKLNPWVGYGIGYEATALGASSGSNKFSAAAAGFEFAHFMGGLDFRVSKGFGVGPFVDFAIGQYSRASSETEVAGRVTQKTDGDIRNTALHQWLTLGVKLTVFP